MMTNIRRRRSTGVNQLGTQNLDNNNTILKYGNLVRPSWQANNPSVFRLLPGLNPDDDYKSFDASYVGGDFGTWVQAVPVVNYAFEKKLSFTLAGSLEDDGWRNCPYCMLYNAIAKYAKSDMALGYYARMVDRGNRDRALPAPERIVLMPVLTYFKNDKELSTDNLSALDILLVKESAFLQIRNFLMNVWMGSPTEFDVTSPDKGSFLVMWNKEKRTPVGLDERCIMRQRSNIGYDLALSQSVPVLYSSIDGASAALTPAQVSWYKMMARPWDAVVRTTTAEEQMDMICRYAPAAAVVYAFQGTEYESYVTPEVKKRAASEPSMTGQTTYPTAINNSGFNKQGYQQPSNYAPYQQHPTYQEPQQPAYQAELPVQGSAFPVSAPVQPTAPKSEFNTRGPAPADVSRYAMDAMNAVEGDEGDDSGLPF